VYLVSVGVKPQVLCLSGQAIYLMQHALCHVLQCSLLQCCAHALLGTTLPSAAVAATAAQAVCHWMHACVSMRGTCSV
jgi:hypothetical protein